jgi:hypothetical protein
MEANHKVGGAAWGWVLGIDYFGPFDPDCDGNVWGLCGVETAHTDLGFLELSANKEALDSMKGVKKMVRDLTAMGPDPLPIVRLHSDQDPSFQAELSEYLASINVAQTDTGGHRPENNSKTEKRIGIITMAFKACLLEATGGTKYYEKLWGVGLKYANYCVNRSSRADGRPSPYSMRMGVDYVWDRKLDHHFGAKVISHVKEDHRMTSFALPAEEGIWVGRSTETPGADIIVPITWDGGAGCYILGKSKAVFGCKVDNGHFPLRSGPDALRPDSLDDFEGFIQSFEYQMYGNEITEEDKAWQIEGEDPLAEVESIELKRGKGKKAKYLVKWVGSDKKTWEPLSHLKGAKDAVAQYEAQFGRQPAKDKAKGKTIANVPVSNSKLNPKPNPQLNPDTNPIVERAKAKMQAKVKAPELANPTNHTTQPNPNPIVARAKAKVKAKAKVLPTSLTDTQPRRSPRLVAALCRIAMLVALVAGTVAAEAPVWVPVDGNIGMGVNDVAIRELILREGVPGSVVDWRAGYQAEMDAVESKRLIKLVGAEMETARRGPCVRLRMRLEAKKDGRKKARLIVQGFREPTSWDVGGTDSPTAAMASIRTLLFMKGLLGDVISSIDVSTAFLQAEEYEAGSMPRYVYYQATQGGPRVYYRLRGCLYGQRTASMEWHRTLVQWLASEGFTQGKNDPCVFTHPITHLTLAVVVDDILVRGHPKHSASFYKALGSKFECKEPSYLTHTSGITYCGLDLSLMLVNGISYVTIDQQVDLERYLEDIGVKNTKKVRNPMPKNYAIYTHPKVLDSERAHRYRSIVGALNFYACALRYDIAYPVSRLSQFSCRPTEGSEKALAQVLAYLNCTTDFALCGSGDSGLSVRTVETAMSNLKHNSLGDVVDVYSDSDHAGQRAEHSKSQSGMIILLNKSPVYWRSSKQVSTAVSSATAEIYSLSDCVKQAKLYQWRAQEMGLQVNNPICIKVDNLQAKSFARGTCVETKLRGTFDIRSDWVQELRDAKEVQVDYIHTSNNYADLLTKSHTPVRFDQLVGMIGNKTVKKLVQAKALMVFAGMVQVA